VLVPTPGPTPTNKHPVLRAMDLITVVSGAVTQWTGACLEGRDHSGIRGESENRSACSRRGDNTSAHARRWTSTASASYCGSW
jgi:hypothetical protein